MASPHPSIRAYLRACVRRPSTAKQRRRQCWWWHGRNARPRLCVEGRFLMASRCAWEDRYGAIPRGLMVTHACGHSRCLNPSHLALVAHAGLQCVRRGSKNPKPRSAFRRTRHPRVRR